MWNGWWLRWEKVYDQPWLPRLKAKQAAEQLRPRLRVGSSAQRGAAANHLSVPLRWRGPGEGASLFNMCVCLRLKYLNALFNQESPCGCPWFIGTRLYSGYFSLEKHLRTKLNQFQEFLKMAFKPMTIKPPDQDQDPFLTIIMTRRLVETWNVRANSHSCYIYLYYIYVIRLGL